MNELLDAIDGLGRDQHGIVGARQLPASRARLGRLVARRQLFREGPHAYRVAGAPRTWEARAMAAVLSAKCPALISYRSAAYLWGLDVPAPGIIDITVPHHRRPEARPGVEFHESRAFDVAQPTIRNRIPVTGIARTLFDCCGVYTKELDRVVLLDDARRLKLATWDELWECHFLHAVRGRKGVAAYRATLLERDGKQPAHGRFVARTALVLRDAGLPTPVFEQPVEVDGHRYRIDIAWPEQMVGLECKGRIGHDYEGAFEADPIRTTRIGLAGWFLMEITWRRLVREPAALAAEVGRALAMRRTA